MVNTKTTTQTTTQRETLGQLVRQTWIVWAKTQPHPKPHWLTPWEKLPDEMKEVDRQIGDAFHHHYEEAARRERDNCLQNLPPDDSRCIQEIVRLEYERTMSFGMTPGITDYRIAIEEWLTQHKVPQKDEG